MSDVQFGYLVELFAEKGLSLFPFCLLSTFCIGSGFWIFLFGSGQVSGWPVTCKYTCNRFYTDYSSLCRGKEKRKDHKDEAGPARWRIKGDS
jgi:hypothetical protein